MRLTGAYIMFQSLLRRISKQQQETVFVNAARAILTNTLTQAGPPLVCEQIKDGHGPHYA